VKSKKLNLSTANTQRSEYTPKANVLNLNLNLNLTLSQTQKYVNYVNCVNYVNYVNERRR